MCICLAYKLESKTADTSEFPKMQGACTFNLLNMYMCINVFTYIHTICINIYVYSQRHINVYIEIIINVPVKNTIFKWKVFQIALERSCYRDRH